MSNPLTNLTPEDIRARLAHLGMDLGDRVTEERGTFQFSQSFDCGEYEEPGDVGWDIFCETQSLLRSVGLHLATPNGGNMDNDTVWGEIVPCPVEDMSPDQIASLAAYLRIKERLALPEPEQTLRTELDLL